MCQVQPDLPVLYTNATSPMRGCERSNCKTTVEHFIDLFFFRYHNFSSQYFCRCPILLSFQLCCSIQLIQDKRLKTSSLIDFNSLATIAIYSTRVTPRKQRLGHGRDVAVKASPSATFLAHHLVQSCTWSCGFCRPCDGHGYKPDLLDFNYVKEEM